MNLLASPRQYQVLRLVLRNIRENNNNKTKPYQNVESQNKFQFTNILMEPYLAALVNLK